MSVRTHRENRPYEAYGHGQFSKQPLILAIRDDRIVDGVVGFTRPMTGGYCWCPPRENGRLNLSALGI